MSGLVCGPDGKHFDVLSMRERWMSLIMMAKGVRGA